MYKPWQYLSKVLPKKLKVAVANVKKSKAIDNFEANKKSSKAPKRQMLDKVDQELVLFDQKFQQWKQTLSPWKLNVLQSLIERYTKGFNEWINNPTDLKRNYLLRRMTESLSKIMNSASIYMQNMDKIEQFDQKFQEWRQELLPWQLEVLQPIIEKYAKKFNDYRNNSNFSINYDVMMDFLVLINSMAPVLKCTQVLTIEQLFASMDQVSPQWQQKRSPLQKIQLTQNLIEEYAVFCESAFDDQISDILVKYLLKVFEPFIMEAVERFDQEFQQQKQKISLEQLKQHQKSIDTCIQVFKDYRKNQELPLLKRLSQTMTTLDKILIRLENVEMLQVSKTSLQQNSELLALDYYKAMNYSAEPLTPLCFLQRFVNASGAYDPGLKTIYIGAEWREFPLSMRLQLLYHEQTHAIQDHAGVLSEHVLQSSIDKFYPLFVRQEAAKHQNVTFDMKSSNDVWKAYEYHADLMSIEHIACPICLRIVQAMRLNKPKLEGYFSYSDIEPFIQRASMDNCCPAHTKRATDVEHNAILQKLDDDLVQYCEAAANVNEILDNGSVEDREVVKNRGKSLMSLLSKLKTAISDLDKKTGSLLEHIPNFYGFHMNKHKQQVEKFAPLIKGLDVQQQLRQLDANLLAGKVRLIETSAQQQERTAKQAIGNHEEAELAKKS